MIELTQELLFRLLRYDPVKGIWTRPRGGKKRVGCVDKTTGYLRIYVFGRHYYAHRLAHLWMLGVWPEHIVDHEDTDKLNNRWVNIRPATHSQNHANTPLISTNTSGFKGVSFYKSTGKWRASISVNKKSLNLGYYATPEEAHKAYVAAASLHFSDFARMQ